MILDQQRKIFHESWYRLAEAKVSLRASVRVHRQLYRGVLWYVLYESFTNQYFRLPEAAYEFISRLSPKKTVGEVWNDMLNGGLEDVPGQGEVIEMLSQLYQANMLSYEGANDGTLLFDPDFLLRRLSWLIAVILSKPFLLVWLLTVAVAVNYGVEVHTVGVMFMLLAPLPYVMCRNYTRP